MRLSRQAQYSIRTVLDLAQRPQGRLADIAARRGIPPSTMTRIVHELSRAGLVRTYRGIGGGVKLARPAEAITLADVINAAEGPPGINLCMLWGDCPCPQPCPVRATLARLEGAVTRELQVTIGELAARWPPPTSAESTTGADRRRRRRTASTRKEIKGG